MQINPELKGWLVVCAVIVMIGIASLIPASAFGDNQWGNPHGTGTTGDTIEPIFNGTAESAATASVGAGAVVVNNTVETAEGGGGGGDIVHSEGDTLLYTINEYEAVAEAVSSLNLGYCTDGGSAGDKRGSFNVGGLSYLCEINIVVPMITGKAKNLHEQGRTDEARAELAKIDDLIQAAKDYIDRRNKTAWLGGFFKDTWWLFALALIGL